MPPRKRRNVSIGILWKPSEEALGPPAPPAAERRKIIEQILGLPPGDLAPERVAFRSRLHDRNYTEALDKIIPAEDHAENIAVQSIQKIIERATARGTRNQGGANVSD